MPAARDTAGRRARLAAAALLAAFAALCLHGLRWDSPTVDEFAHLPAGYYYLETGDFNLYNLNPPLVRLVSALPLLALRPDLDRAPRLADSGWYPWVFGTDFMRRNRGAYELIFLCGRLPVVALGVLLGWLVWVWARRLYGEGGGLVALAAYCFCPSIVAHAHLATTDVGFALATTGALYLGARWLERPSVWALVIFGAALGAAQLAKFSGLVLYPVVLLLALARLVGGGRFPLVRAGGGRGDPEGWGDRGDGGDRGGPGDRAGRGDWVAVAWSLAALAAVSVLVVDAGYLMQGVGRPLAAWHPRSQRFQGLVAALPGWLRVPLPGAYLSGLDALQLINEQGEFPTYLLGRWLERGSWAYYPLTLLVKTPLPLLLAWAVAPFARLAGRSARVADAAAGGRERRVEEAFLWLPALALLAFFSFGSRVDYGIRYLMPILPLACVYTGRLVPWVAERGVWMRRLAVAMLALYPCSILLATPNTLDYFNLLAAGRGDRLLLDSNLDWGQGLKRLRAWLDREHLPGVALAYFGHVDPAIYGIHWRFPTPDRPGPVVVSANFVHGYPYVTNVNGHMVPIPAGTFAWIARYPRTADLGGGLYLYVIPPAAANGR